MEQLKNAAISAKILQLCAQGMSIREAADATLGKGAYDKIAGIVYDELRRRQMKK